MGENEGIKGPASGWMRARFLFNKGKSEVINDMAGFQYFAVYGEENGLGLKGAEVCVDHTSGDHQFSGGAHGAD